MSSLFLGCQACSDRATSALKGTGFPTTRPTSSAFLEPSAHAHMYRVLGNLIDLLCLS